MLRVIPQFAGFLLAAGMILLAPSVFAQTAPAVKGLNQNLRESLNALEGKLIVPSEGAPRVAAGGVDVLLESDAPSLLRVLGDPRLNGRVVRLEGRANPDGAFAVSHLFTVRDGKLFKLRYYCHVCNIAATEPGPCVCCQRPTDLEEIPVSEVTDDMVVVP